MARGQERATGARDVPDHGPANLCVQSRRTDLDGDAGARAGLARHRPHAGCLDAAEELPQPDQGARCYPEVAAARRPAAAILSVATPASIRPNCALTAASEKRSSTVRRAASASLDLRPSSPNSDSSATANRTALSGATRTAPDASPCSNISATDGISLATTGNPQAIASSGATGRPSRRDGKA